MRLAVLIRKYSDPEGPEDRRESKAALEPPDTDKKVQKEQAVIVVHMDRSESRAALEPLNKDKKVQKEREAILVLVDSKDRREPKAVG